MKQFIELYDYYLNDVPDCSYITGANALRMAAQEFCTRSRAWRAKLAPIVTVEGQTAYPVPMAAGQELVVVLGAQLDGRDIDVLLGEHAGGHSRGVIMLNQSELLLQPLHAPGQSLVLHAALKPSNDATGIEDLLYAHYAEAIAEGAKARLFGTNNQPFSDPNAALRARINFNDAIGAAKVAVAKAHSRAPLRVRPSFM